MIVKIWVFIGFFGWCLEPPPKGRPLRILDFLTVVMSSTKAELQKKVAEEGEMEDILPEAIGPHH